MSLKKIIALLFSTRLMAVLFIVFAVAMAVGTFIEHYQNTTTARMLVYNTWWFETIIVFFVINFIGNIKRYQLYKKGQWSVLLLHLSFILIIIGAFITRYISYEGMMNIREGETSKTFLSEKSYLTLWVDGDYKGEMKRKTFMKPLLLAPYCDESVFCSNAFSITGSFSETPFKVKYKKYYFGATQSIKPSASGVLYLKLVESSTGSRNEHFFKDGEVKNISNILFAFNKPTLGAINITAQGNSYTINSPFEGNYTIMASQQQGAVTKNIENTLNFRSLYQLGGIQFVLPELPQKGELVFENNPDLRAKNLTDVLVVTLETQNTSQDVILHGGSGRVGEPRSVCIGNLDFTFSFGSRLYELPFQLKLNDFIAERYPGTENSYSAYKSKLTVIDQPSFDYDIYMNHVLDHKGYRLFQASFNPDEKGTILSVSHDYWGTWITYIGYFLLYFSMIVLLFAKGTRFGSLRKKLRDIQTKKITVLILSLFSIVAGYSQHTQSPEELYKTIQKYNVSTDHAKKFGRMVVQDDKGRMKPINTFASELLRKVSKSDTYKNMSADQVLLSITQYPEYWYNIPLLYVKRGNDSIRHIAGVDSKTEHIALVNFFENDGTYKLTKILDQANRSAVKNKFETDIIDIDSRIHLLYDALSGRILKIFPIPNDPNNKWLSYLDLHQPTGTSLDTIKNILPLYKTVLQKATQSHNYAEADQLLKGIELYQKKYGSAVRPTDDKIDTEILYNQYDIFKKLFSWYMYAGVLLLIVALIQIFNSRKIFKTLSQVLIAVTILLFMLHTAGLIARWYISGHAPWSDAYESIIYVSWATMLFGFIFGRKSALTIASTAFAVSIILMIAHKSWLDPAIGNLQPVLNSYWLMIHVAIIVGSYGPFTLAFILGTISLFLILFTNKTNQPKMKLAIDELTLINEMTLTVGLVLLTVGNFLGGQWANESWGRYWGWDPKETWALISIMLYAFIIHMRLVPGLRSRFAFNFASVLGYFSVLMTYFGVNFYLVGLHSYATGEIQTPIGFIILAVFVLLLGLSSYIRFTKMYKK